MRSPPTSLLQLSAFRHLGSNSSSPSSTDVVALQHLIDKPVRTLDICTEKKRGLSVTDQIFIHVSTRLSMACSQQACHQDLIANYNQEPCDPYRGLFSVVSVLVGWIHPKGKRGQPSRPLIGPAYSGFNYQMLSRTALQAFDVKKPCDFLLLLQCFNQLILVGAVRATVCLAINPLAFAHKPVRINSSL